MCGASPARSGILYEVVTVEASPAKGLLAAGRRRAPLRADG